MKYLLEDAQLMNETEGVAPRKEWWKSDPEKLLAFVYWLQNSLPPSDPIKRDEAYKRIVSDLHNVFPGPTNQVNWHWKYFSVNEAKQELTEGTVSITQFDGGDITVKAGKYGGYSSTASYLLQDRGQQIVDIIRKALKKEKGVGSVSITIEER